MSDQGMVPPPGRERDAAIALALGWTKSCWDDGTFIHLEDAYPCVDHPRHWSTSDATAVQLLSEATKRGWVWVVATDDPDGVCAMMDYNPSLDKAMPIHQHARTIADAVSAAFLAAHTESTHA